uniref:Tripartite motif-containing protein 16-like n=1 Tax=Cyprinodon variegatus TaxID=28743 RepID=A0A3Q2E8D0_CYPVA
MRAELDRESFSCSICLDLLRDPVTIPCGHSYCMKCIENIWDEEDEKEVHSCPQCRQTFKPRPTLVKNIMLAALTEQLKMTGLGASPSTHSYAGPEDVACDICTGRKLKMFCRTDQQSICYVCTVDEHKDHDIVSGAAERMENESEKILFEMICLIQQRSSELKQQIRSQQESEVKRVKEFQKKLELEICELKRKEVELEQFLHIEDHSFFLQHFPSLSSLSESDGSSNINVRPLNYFEDVTAAVSELRDKFQDILMSKCAEISFRVTEVDVLLSEPEPKTREDFLRYSTKITLDPDTAHTKLLISEGNRKVVLMNQSQVYNVHPERFIVPFQVLSKQSITGRIYWEVEWGGMGCCVAVVHKDVNTAESEFGSNNKSWALLCSKDKHEFLHNNTRVPISDSDSSRIGVYLNQKAGTISFYSVSEAITRLFKVKTTFPDPLYTGISLFFSCGDTAEICEL